MAEAYLVGAVRAPVGKRGGGLQWMHPADTPGHGIQKLVSRHVSDPAEASLQAMREDGGQANVILEQIA